MPSANNYYLFLKAEPGRMVYVDHNIHFETVKTRNGDWQNLHLCQHLI